MIPKNQPATSYDLNILASVLGRCNTDIEHSGRDTEDIRCALDETLEALAIQKPLATHTDPELLRQSVDFVGRIDLLARGERVKMTVDDRALRQSHALLSKIRIDCLSRLHGDASAETLVDPQDVAGLFGIEDLWERAPYVIRDENLSYSQGMERSNVPPELESPISLDEAMALISYVRGKLFGDTSAYPVNAHLTPHPDKLHLFWAASDGGIDYAIPSSQTLANHLSFDVPHNAVHISHLSLLGDRGCNAYWDAMPQRAYFEALAVLSERQMLDMLSKDSSCVEEMADILLPKRRLDHVLLRNWMIRDRSFEARLRNARLAADHFTIQGVAFSDLTHEVASSLGMSEDDVGAEVRKYYRLTGLGANYTLGSRKLWDQGVRNPFSAMTNSSGFPISTWNERSADVLGSCSKQKDEGRHDL